MKRDVVIKYIKNFKESVHVEDGIEFWMAREIQALLESEVWTFLKIVRFQLSKLKTLPVRQALQQPRATPWVRHECWDAV